MIPEAIATFNSRAEKLRAHHRSSPAWRTHWPGIFASNAGADGLRHRRVPGRILQTRRLFLRPDGSHGQPKPAGQKTDSADRRDGAQPARPGGGQQIKRAGKNHDARQKAPPRSGGRWLPSGQHKQHDGMKQMVRSRCLPNRRRSILRQDFIQAVRAKRAERHGQKAGDGCNPGGIGAGHNGSQNGRQARPVKFNNWCSFAFIHV